jgi:hypothetical protein
MTRKNADEPNEDQKSGREANFEEMAKAKSYETIHKGTAYFLVDVMRSFLLMFGQF